MSGNPNEQPRASAAWEKYGHPDVAHRQPDKPNEQPRASAAWEKYGHPDVAHRQPDNYPQGPFYTNQQSADPAAAYNKYGYQGISRDGQSPAAQKYEAARPAEYKSDAAKKYGS